MKNWIKKIKSWSIEKKRIFSISIALVLTILIIVFNSGINLLWKDKTQKKNIDTPLNSIQKSFSEIINESKPIFEKAFSSSTFNEIVKQNSQSTSSSSTSTNIVE